MPKPAKKPAPRGANKYRAAEITKIQIAKRWAMATLPGFDDDRYRDILQEAGSKKRSSTDLDWRGRMAVLQRFEELGWVPTPGKAAKTNRRLADDPQSAMLRALWIQLHQAGKVRDPGEGALCAFAKRMTRKDALQWLSDRDVTVVKKALVDWLER